MTITRLRKIGGSVMVPIPKAILKLANLPAGSLVEIAFNGGVLEIRPARPRYTLDELLDGSDYSQSRTAEEQEWLDAPPVGREIL